MSFFMRPGVDSAGHFFQYMIDTLRKSQRLSLRLMIDNKEELMDRYSVEIVPTVIVFENGRVKRRCDGEAGASG